jgi:hypothetical protein
MVFKQKFNSIKDRKQQWININKKDSVSESWIDVYVAKQINQETKYYILRIHNACLDKQLDG